MVQRFALCFVCLVALAAPAAAAPVDFFEYYFGLLSGPAEEPANSSPGTGVAIVGIDAVNHAMWVRGGFGGLTSAAIAADIHLINGPGDANSADTLGPVATTTFTTYPSGTTGSFDSFLDMTLASSYGAGFLTDAGGTTALAELALFDAIANKRAYIDVHTTSFPDGEIRSFLQLNIPEPGTMLLVGAGLAGLVRMRKLKSR